MTPDDLRQALDDANRRSERAAAATDRLLDRLRRDRLRCVECGSSWGDPTERFRAYLTDEPPDVAVFCPSCAELEFGLWAGRATAASSGPMWHSPARRSFVGCAA